MKEQSTYAILENRLDYASSIASQRNITEAAQLVGQKQTSSALYYIAEEDEIMIEPSFLNYMSQENIEGFLRELMVEKSVKGSFLSIRNSVYYLVDN